MELFRRLHASILGVLSGFDRLVFRGSLRQLAFLAGMKSHLYHEGVLLKDFAKYAERCTAQLKAASLEEAERLGRRVVYLPSSATSKEEVARAIAAECGIDVGLVCVLKSVEPCLSYEIYRNREKKLLELKPRKRKCLYLYHYFIDPRFGFMHARIQTWFPFSIQVCLNGREWLSRDLDREGIDYVRRDNTFAEVADVERAQALLDDQLRLAWPDALDAIARRLNPAHDEIARDHSYYWSCHQSEWATDVMFENSDALAAIYQPFVLHGINSFSSADVMRFLGGKVHGNFKGEIVSDFKDRPEGVRLKHTVAGNSVKLYDKQGTVLRVETTINQPDGFKVYRTKEGEPDGPMDWRPMRKGIADLHRRAEVSQATNDRYLEALASVEDSTPFADLLSPYTRRVTWKKKRFRGLRPWDEQDLALLHVVARGEFTINGFRNRDLRLHLFDAPAADKVEERRRAGKVTRMLRLLRAHKLIRKIPKSHRYKLTPKGRQLATAMLAASRMTVEQLNLAA